MTVSSLVVVLGSCSNRVLLGPSSCLAEERSLCNDTLKALERAVMKMMSSSMAVIEPPFIRLEPANHARSDVPKWILKFADALNSQTICLPVIGSGPTIGFRIMPQSDSSSSFSSSRNVCM